ncbi:MAG: hypothetical protein EXS38_06890 [Opitutus sp.]|nr:hypothetical protein [Opitutus sp.]
MSNDSTKPTRKRRRQVSGLVGLGLDNEDGHKRITTGYKFALLGGSQETHEHMTETVMKTFEELKRREKHLEQVGPEELGEIIAKSRPR